VLLEKKESELVCMNEVSDTISGETSLRLQDPVSGAAEVAWKTAAGPANA